MRPWIIALMAAGVMGVGLGVGPMLLRAPALPPSLWEELEHKPESEARRRSLRPTAEEQARSHAEYANLRPLLAAILRADKVILFEGLPHQRWEGDLLEQELAAKQTTRIHGFPFYASPLPLGKDDVERIMEFFRNPRLFEQKPPGPLHMKLCGGFHPDYAMEFHVGAESYQVLICLGCSEVKFYGPATSLYCDISADSQNNAERRFRPYRKNRPLRAAH